MSLAKLPIVVLISGRGSNLQSIIDGIASGTLDAELRCVVSNQPDAPGLDRARRAGVAGVTVDHRTHPSRAAFDAALSERIDAYQPDLVVLAGFMRILTAGFVKHYPGRLINIHPSLLPAFPGLDTHRRAIESGATEHGASVHFVTPELDGGPTIVQARVPVLSGDSADLLAARVLEQEHRIPPRAIQWFAQGRLELRDGLALLDGIPTLEDE